MLKRISTILLALPLVMFLFSSCTKDVVIDDSSDIEGTWAVTGIRSSQSYDWDGDGDNETDILGTYSSCQRDIVLVFEYNGYGQARQGCNASWQNLYWSLDNNNRRLAISLSGDDLNLDITQITSNTIRGEDRVNVDGRSFVVTYTLSRR